jgi:flagellar assembly factor FliW
MTTMIAQPAGATTRALHFVEPLPGFDGEDDFTLGAIDPRGLLYALRSVRDPQLRFVLAPPEGFFPDYHPAIPDEIGHLLDAEQVELLVMLSISSGLADATANLRAPVVFSAENGRAVQVILDDERLPMHRPLLPARAG